MPENQIDLTGIHIQTFQEILSDIVNGTATVVGLKTIYGSDINIDQNSPDGQMINIFALSKKDLLDLLVSIYNAKDPDQAVGVDLDSVSQLCGIARKGGTYTLVDVDIVTDRALTLNGLDTTTPFTISDSTGNLYYLITSETIGGAGTTTAQFRSALLGDIQCLPNTLTVVATPTLGILSVNNPNAVSQQGQDEETDNQFRLRRQRSTAGPAQGVQGALFSALNNLPDVIEAMVFVNNTASADIHGVPAHSAWCIVDGGSDEDISEVIYKYLNAGCGMKGNEIVGVLQIDGSQASIAFDRAIDEPLHIKFTAQSLTGGFIDTNSLASGIVAQYVLGINEPADTTSIAAIVHGIDPTIAIYNSGVGLNGVTYWDVKAPSAVTNKFTLEVGNIIIT